MVLFVGRARAELVADVVAGPSVTRRRRRGAVVPRHRLSAVAPLAVSSRRRGRAAGGCAGGAGEGTARLGRDGHALAGRRETGRQHRPLSLRHRTAVIVVIVDVIVIISSSGSGRHCSAATFCRRMRTQVELNKMRLAHFACAD